MTARRAGLRSSASRWYGWATMIPTDADGVLDLPETPEVRAVRGQMIRLDELAGEIGSAELVRAVNDLHGVLVDAGLERVLPLLVAGR